MWFGGMVGGDASSGILWVELYDSILHTVIHERSYISKRLIMTEVGFYHVTSGVILGCLQV